MTEALYFLQGGGEAGRAIREFDWSRNSLGAFASWPVSLKTAADMMLHSKFPKALVWGPEMITLHNEAFKTILGEKPPAIGLPFSHIWAEAWKELEPIVDRAFQGKATFIRNFPLAIDRHGYLEQAYFTFCYSPIHDESGAVAGMMDTIIETTSTVVAQQQLQTINGELAHRMRNMVAVVSSLTTQSLRFHTDIKSTIERLRRRFGALAQVQAALDAQQGSSADLHELISNAIAPYPQAEDRVSMAGPKLQIRESQATALSLALNELITNSLKYGAWSRKKGRVELSWSLNGEFIFNWREIDGPAVKPPAKTGYGSELMEKYVASTFSGTAEITYDPRGVRYELRAPLRAVRQPGRELVYGG